MWPDTCTMLSREQNNLEKTPRPSETRSGDQTHTHTHRGRWKKEEDTVLRLPRDKVFYLFSSVAMRMAWKKKKSIATKYHRPLPQSKGPWTEESLETSYFPFRFVQLCSLFDATSFVSALLCLHWEYSEQLVSLASSVNSRKSLQKLMSGRFFLFFFLAYSSEGLITIAGMLDEPKSRYHRWKVQ